MIIECFRCQRGIKSPHAGNADYIIAQDTIAREPRDVLIALKHNQITLAKVARIKNKGVAEGDHEPPTKDFIRSQFQDNEYDAVEVPDLTTAYKQFGEDLVRVVGKVREKDIQKTGIVCPGCYRDTDFVIWGVHKGA